jgi:hypothetical protein
MDVERWLAEARPGGRHRRRLSELTVAEAWGKRSARRRINWWSLFAHLATFWAPSPLLRCCGYGDGEMRQAFREKVALCLIIVVMCGLLGVFTLALGPILCPSKAYDQRMLWRSFVPALRANYSIIGGCLYPSVAVAAVLNCSVAEVSGRDLTERLEIPFDSDCRRLVRPPSIVASAPLAAALGRMWLGVSPRGVA